jgi:purine-cytosine permease-like protein
MGLSVSVIGVWLAKVPRLIWPIFITAIGCSFPFSLSFTIHNTHTRTQYIPIAIPIAGANSFSSLEDFMNVLGYWLSIFVVVVLLEHFFFRRGDWAQYNTAETRNRLDKTPVGIAALLTFLLGALGTAMRFG